MALIKCKECGHEVSDKASMCPNCGCPIESLGAAKEEVMYEEPKKKNGWIWALIVAVLLCILVGGYYGYAHYANSEDEVDSIYVDNNKYAIVELTPQFIKALEVYDELTPFSEGYAAVKRGGKWGYINTKGEEIIPCKYEEAEGFREGCAKVREGAVSSYINTKGENVTPKKFSGKTEKEKGMLYEVFSINDDNNWGLKDANGSIIIDAVYSGIDIGKGLWATENRGTISNGVVLVILDELKDTYDNTDGEPTENDIIRHYGYADLKGNDTFTGHLKYLCQEAEKKAFHIEEGQGEYDAEIMEGNGNYDWLQGTWTTKAIIMGQTKLAKLVIDGNYATFYSDGEVLDKGEYEIYDDKINFGSTYIHIDEEKQLIKYDDNHYFSHSSQPTTSVNVATPEQEKELKIMARLHELGEKGKSLVSELSAMRQRGQMDPARYLYIKQALIQYKDEQIRLSQELGDEQMAREYMQQKDGVLQSFRKIENGY